MSEGVGVNRQIVLVERPIGPLTDDHFRLREVPIPEPAEGEILTRTLYLSIDPANRVWIGGDSYRPAVALGGPMDGYSLSRVETSKHPDFVPGDVVHDENGWQDYRVNAPGRLIKVQPREPLERHLSVLGLTGLTAYFGLLDIGRPRSGECVLVSSAAGAVGSITGQIAKLKGCRVVGVAGGAEKCDWIVDELGFDAAIDYKAETDIGQALADACPDGIDVYFDNVGGDTLQAALFLMNRGGRVVCCGSISHYDAAQVPAGPVGIPALLVARRLRLEGFLVTDYRERWESATTELERWLDSGEIQSREDVIDGLERAPQALADLLVGANFGKRIVRVATESPMLR